jgi:hypothetical protein
LQGNESGQKEGDEGFEAQAFLLFPPRLFIRSVFVSAA